MTGKNLYKDKEIGWNGIAGQNWVSAQQLMDHMLFPFEKILAELVAAKSPAKLLDVGCGAGTTTLTAAKATVKPCMSTGIDISEAMTSAARNRAFNNDNTLTEFICADAQTYKFKKQYYDMIISRFGVMFFDDSIEAFANLYECAAPNAELRFVCWRSPEENPFMCVAAEASKPLIPDIPEIDSNQPGQFAFENKERVYKILEKSLWDNIKIEALDVECSFPKSDLIPFFTTMGLLSRLYENLPIKTQEKVVETVGKAFEPYICGDKVTFTAACWLVSAYKRCA